MAFVFYWTIEMQKGRAHVGGATVTHLSLYPDVERGSPEIFRLDVLTGYERVEVGGIAGTGRGVRKSGTWYAMATDSLVEVSLSGGDVERHTGGGMLKTGTSTGHACRIGRTQQELVAVRQSGVLNDCAAARAESLDATVHLHSSTSRTLRARPIPEGIRFALAPDAKQRDFLCGALYHNVWCSCIRLF